MDLIIPDTIWNSDELTLEQKIIQAVIEQNQDKKFTLKELCGATHITRGRLLRAIQYFMDCDYIRRKKILTENNTIGTLYMHFSQDYDFMKDLDACRRNK